MIAVRYLDTVMRSLYTDRPGKLAARLRASHIERPPKKINT